MRKYLDNDIHAATTATKQTLSQANVVGSAGVQQKTYVNCEGGAKCNAVSSIGINKDFGLDASVSGCRSLSGKCETNICGMQMQI